MTINLAFIEYPPCASSLHTLFHFLLTTLYTNISFVGRKELKKFKCKKFHNCLARKGQRQNQTQI